MQSQMNETIDVMFDDTNRTKNLIRRQGTVTSAEKDITLERSRGCQGTPMKIYLDIFYAEMQ